MLTRRFLAYIIDLGLALFMPLLYSMVAGEKKIEGGWTLHGANTIPAFILIILYYVLFDYFCNRTLAKYLFKLKVVRLDGAKITFSDACVRNSLTIFEVVFCPVIAGICILASSHRQRLGDMLAKTVVVKAGAARDYR